jgi:S-adenosylmethionine synthetase
VAIAFVDRFIDSEKIYFERKDRVRAALERHLAPALGELSELTLSINTLDAPGGGADSDYLTVTGTSAEGADSGQVGRGNRLSGVFSALRPSSNEAIAGKNPHSHVGKIYNHLAQHIAGRIAELEGVREAGVHLVSQIGRPLSEPHLAAVELALEQGVGVDDVQSRGVEIVEAALREPTRF